MVAQALVFAIGAVTRIELFENHFTVRLRRREYLAFAAVAGVVWSDLSDLSDLSDESTKYAAGHLPARQPTKKPFVCFVYFVVKKTCPNLRSSPPIPGNSPNSCA